MLFRVCLLYTSPLHPHYRSNAQDDSLAQLVEHNTFNVGVLGSSPRRITENKRKIKQIDVYKRQYETILDDLKTALDNLPETSKVVTAVHIDYWGARALRARAYLYMNENSKALEDAKYVIEKSPYKLYTRDEYETVWTKVGSSESIFEFLITSLYNACLLYTSAILPAKLDITSDVRLSAIFSPPTDVAA